MNSPRKLLDLINSTAEEMRPEARDLVRSLLSDPIPVTKHNYARLLAFCSQLPKNTRFVFLLACVKEGYPAETAKELTNQL